MAVGCGEERIAPDTIFLFALPTNQSSPRGETRGLQFRGMNPPAKFGVSLRDTIVVTSTEYPARRRCRVGGRHRCAVFPVERSRKPWGRPDARRRHFSVRRKSCHSAPESVCPIPAASLSWLAVGGLAASRRGCTGSGGNRAGGHIR